METTFEKEQIGATDILNFKVSYQPNAFSSFTKELSISQVLEEIKNETHSVQIKKLRELLNSGDDNGYGIHKRNLPAVTFCGTFDNKRKKSALKNYNRLIVLDIDKLSPDELQKAKDSFANDEFVFSFWESPSQKGIKGLVHLSYNAETDPANLDYAHKGAFSKLTQYFDEKYGIELDISGSDTTRLCFLSYDPATVIKSTVISFEVSKTDILEVPERKETTEKAKTIRKSSNDVLFNPLNRNHPRNRKAMTAIIRFLSKRNLTITSSYEHWFKISLAIANAFTYEVGEKYFLQLSEMDKEKFNETNCRNLLLNSYDVQSGEISFQTIEYLAIQQGYITKRIREGSSEAARESKSQVSTSIDGSLPEVLKSGE